jgi:N-methylhydantoinase B
MNRRLRRLPQERPAHDARDPILLEIMQSRLEQVAAEMQTVLLRTSRSMIVREARDASAAIFTGTCEQIAQSVSIPLHLGMTVHAVRTVANLFSGPTMHDGDVYIVNDPFNGGAHLPDIIIVAPVFVDGTLIAYVSVVAHHQDIGGGTAGGNNMNATEVYQEGLRIPPARLYDRGQPNEMLFALLEANVRTPEVVLADLRAQLAACYVGKERLIELARKYGASNLVGSMARMLDDAEELTKSALASIPTGTYHFVEWIDHDGIDLECRRKIEALVTVKRGSVEIDLTRSCDQVPGPINSTPASTHAAAYFIIRAICGSGVPNNSGCHRRVSVLTRAGSILDAQLPAAVNSRGSSTGRVVSCLLGAFAPALPQRVPANSGSGSGTLKLSGTDPENMRYYIAVNPEGGGTGAASYRDGIDGLQGGMANASNVPVEELERQVPVRVIRYRFRPDSGGPGEFRGGMGTEKEFEVLRGEMELAVRADNHLAGPYGLAGGRPGARSECSVVEPDGIQHAVPSKGKLKLAAGERFRIATAGGGGYGDPLEREVARIAADIADGRVTPRAAFDHHGVITRDGVPDLEASRLRRAEMNALRGPITRFFDMDGLSDA